MLAGLVPFKRQWPPAKLLLLLIILLAFGLRVWQLETIPPGWRDDELIEALVISQKVLEGDIALFYPDASGHEGLGHIMAAGMLLLFGPGVWGIRFLPAILGTLTVPLTYLLGVRLFSRRVGLVAAAALALSFWSLMYSRFGLRQITQPGFMLAAFYFFWRGLAAERQVWRSFFWAGLLVGIGFYTYFAARGIPLILLAVVLYGALFYRPTIRRQWRGILLTFGLAFLIAIPLLVTLQHQPEAEARVAEVARPLREAQAGDFALLLENTRRTLLMAHADGDDEWLYNIPFRPLFGPVGAIFFWLGLLLAVGWAARPMWARWWPRQEDRQQGLEDKRPFAAAFLIAWWLAGISPGFLSIPAASLSHTIIAQSAFYLLAALPLLLLPQLVGPWLPARWPRLQPAHLATLLGLLLLLSIARRDLVDYFTVWPERGMTRFLYRADIKNLADYLAQDRSVTDFGVTSLLAGPWDKLALELDLAEETAVQPRWYNPERALLLRPRLSFSGYPVIPVLYEEAYQPLPGETAGGYQLASIDSPFKGALVEEPVCFVNGLCWLGADFEREEAWLDLVWGVERPLDLPPLPLVSNPPPPGVYAGPRLFVFAQLVSAEEQFLTGDDGLWVDPATLYNGDRFLQQHRFSLPPEQDPAFILLGLYDPLTGERILTEDGRDHIRLGVAE